MQAVTLAAMLLVTTQARAALPVVKMEEVQSGALLFADPDGRFRAAPLLRTDVDLDVRGVLLRGVVRQTFTNPTAAFMEAVYVFPLSDGAAVDELRMIVGDRVIEGRIHERRRAEEIYEAAKAEGKKASLVVEQRPNVFTTNVANVGPGEQVEIEIAWQEVLRYDAGKVSLRVPLVVAPRYAPDGASPWRPSPATTAAAAPRVRIAAHVDAGFPVAAMTSRHHDVRTDLVGKDRWAIELVGAAPADRDFVLEWIARPLTAPTAAVFTEKRGDDVYAVVLVVPPTAAADVKRLPRETIFVVDTSGSMAGTSMEQAQAALRVGLGTLTDGDAFNVVRFSSDASQLFDGAVPATRANVDRALRWVDGLVADGGTEMHAALQLALDGRKETEKVRQVVFVTDGAVTNEEQLFALIRAQLGASRLFTVGIGSAPNSFFMRKAAEYGRGTFTYVGATHEVQAKIGALFGKIESPVLSRVAIDWGDASVEEHPRRVPDLYAGEPLVVAAKLRAPPTSIRVDGRLHGAPWAARVELPAPYEEAGVAKLWAKRKIDGLIDEDGHGEGHRAQVVALALQHHLVTKYTSLVAVDVTPTKPTDAATTTLNVPTALPHGQLPQGGTASTLFALLGALALAAGLLVARRGATEVA